VITSVYNSLVKASKKSIVSDSEIQDQAVIFFMV